ncbi:MAG: sulfatase [Patescibacteria group bacterium]|nr:sulfatase [Patescibacteria group bacterium]
MPIPLHQAEPNVIVISVDSLGASHMGLYGYARDTTPQIDAWAKGGLVFQNYFATSYLTPISEASVQTGQYPFTNGMVSFTTNVRGTTEMLAEVLKQHGYATAAFGSSPEFSNDGDLGESFSRGFDTFQPFPTSASASFVAERSSDAPITDALQWLRKEKTTAHPFYLWLPLGGVHEPYNDGAPAVFEDPSYKGYLKRIADDSFFNAYGFIYASTTYAVGDPTHAPLAALGSFTAADKAYLIARYDDGIHATDAMLGQLFAYLQSSGLDRNTIVVLESEHGETMGERQYFWHYDIYDETTHVPLIIHAPGAGARRVQSLISGVDVMPTLLGLLHIQAPSSLDGINYTPYLQSLTTTPPRTNVFITRTPLWEVTGGIVPALEKPDATAHYHDTAIRSSAWLLIHRLSRQVLAQYGWWGMVVGVPQQLPEYQLYNLTTDPGETTDVYQQFQNDPAVQALTAKLDAYDASVAAHTPGPSGPAQPYF